MIAMAARPFVCPASGGVYGKLVKNAQILEPNPMKKKNPHRAKSTS